MNIIQEKILKEIQDKDLGSLSLRDIARLIGEDGNSPQTIKHHLDQLEKKGLIIRDRSKKSITKRQPHEHIDRKLIAIPILGSANCGDATIYADQNVEGYLTISSSIVKNKKGLFAIKAVGASMNKAKIGLDGKNIEEGDFVIIDSSQNSPQNKDYVLSVIDGVANIKKFVKDHKNNQIVLISESTKDYTPIYIGQNEVKYFVNGKVIQVVKKPSI